MKIFILDYSTKTHSFWKLLNEDKDYTWTETREQALKNLNPSLNSESCVFYFSNHKEIFIYIETLQNFGDSLAEIEKPRKL